jgi:3',5'-nucleoside bisphosphate phosphatase
MRVDLHLHTWVSDGDVSPTELVRLAAASGLAVLAVTDHDTAAGVAEAQAASRSLPVAVVPGIEISTGWGDQELHILGYWIDPAAAAIVAHQEWAVRRRARRMESMVARLQEMGVAITYEDVELAAGPEVHALGRPHLARALFARGQTRFYGEAFTRYIGDAGPAFVSEGFPSPQDAIELIHAAGGVAAWAHPPLEWFESGLPLLREWGLDGVECFRPGTDPTVTDLLATATREAGLFPTGGSDWHGPHRAALGTFTVDALQVRDLLRIGGLAD